jgi:16S rRNA (uracil1498-N3)-methyltransferase
MSDRLTPAQKLRQIQQELGQRLQRLTLRSPQSPPLAIKSTRDQKIELIELTTEQQHYLTRVLRLGQGDKFVAIDTYGRWWLAQLEADQNNRISAQLIDLLITDRPSNLEIILAVAMPKGNGFEAIIKPVVELGVDRIVPLYSDRTVFSASKPIGQQKQQRWQRIAAEAIEQSLQTRITEISQPQSFKDFVSSTSPANHAQKNINQSHGYKYLCVTHDAPHLLSTWQSAWGKEMRSLHQQSDQFSDQDRQANLSDLLVITDVANSINSTNPTNSEIVDTTDMTEDRQNLDRRQLIITTGPEGGWTAEEEAIALSHNFQPISLGSQILAATTAPVVALAIVNGVMQAYDYA